MAETMELTRIIRDSEDKLTTKEIEDTITDYLKSGTYNLLQRYNSYYAGVNYELVRRVNDRQWRSKTPNNYVPTAYYSTVVDTMAGYMFSNVQYQGVEDVDLEYSETFNEILDANNVDVKDMQTGINSLCFNRGIELVYTEGDETATDIKFSTFSPLEWVIIYDNKVESEVFCGIRVVEYPGQEYDYIVDVIYADEWQYYTMKGGAIKQKDEPRLLDFPECPVVVYNASIVNNQSPFHVVIPYIDALDFIMTGNANEVERLVDAILVLGKSVADEELLHMDAWKVLQDMKADERAEYITKDASPEFREYVSKLLINEIHKHSHVIDWYSPGRS
jgi:SPP1 family phage portal protein